MTLVAAMSAVCPSSEVDELTVSLLTIFEHRGLSFELLEVLIKQEIEETGETGSHHSFLEKPLSINNLSRQRIRDITADVRRNQNAFRLR